jgi:hypothetical protein
LLTRKEQAGRKRMDEFKDRLNVVDSKVATEMIERLLLNKNSNEYHKE